MHQVLHLAVTSALAEQRLHLKLFALELVAVIDLRQVLLCNSTRLYFAICRLQPLVVHLGPAEEVDLQLPSIAITSLSDNPAL